MALATSPAAATLHAGDVAALAADWITPGCRALLIGQPGTGKSTLAAALAAQLDSMGQSCWCLGADPGLPAFGVPGALSVGEWREGAWQVRGLAALCTLDAGRFRLPLVAAVGHLLRDLSGITLLIDGPGVVRGTPGEELLHALAAATRADLVIVLARAGHAPPLVQELAALGIPRITVIASDAARRPGRAVRGRVRTRLWDAYLANAGEQTLTMSALRILGTPPPLASPEAWTGRQVALLDGARLLALGEVLSVNDDRMQVRAPTCAPPTALLVRNAARSAEGILETLPPFAAEPLEHFPAATKPRTGMTGARRIGGRVGNVDVTLVNGVLGDPLLHLRPRHQRRSLLFDIGAGARLSARVAHEVSDLFISHAHMDHIAGFLWLLRSRVGELPPCRVYGPPGMARRIEHLVQGILWDRVGARGPCFEVAELHGEHLLRWRVQAGASRSEPLEERAVTDGILLHEPGFRVRAVTLDHGTPVLAFAFEPERQLNVRKDRLLARGLAPGRWLGELKRCLLEDRRDALIELPDGTRSTVAELGAELVLSTPGRKIAYATDLADTPGNRARLIRLAQGAHTFFCEAPFRAADREQAARTGHLTTRACGEIASLAGVARLVPFHFSRRYEDDVAPTYEEIAAVCSRVMLPPELASWESD